MRFLLAGAGLAIAAGSAQGAPFDTLIAHHQATSGCSAEFEPRDVTVLTLDEAHRLYVLPCEDFAYNFVSALYWLDGETVSEAPLPSAALMEASDRDNQVYTPSWEAATKTLDSFYKGGNGNCGAEGRWRWSGSDFVLVDIRARETCDQSDDEWPLIAP